MVSLKLLHEMCREGHDEAEAAGDTPGGLSVSYATATTAPAPASPAPTSSGPPTNAPASTSGNGTISRAATSTGTATTVMQNTSVFHNADLLREIFLRLDRPYYLIRAATVCKLWLLSASEPLFLQKFHKQNPLRILGFYVLADRLLHPRFVPFGDEHSDISPMLTFASSQFEVWEDVHVTIWDCKNGKLLVEIGDRLEVRDFLTRPCSIAAYPQSPLKFVLNRSFTYQHHEFLPHNGGDGHEYYRLALGHRGGCIIACLSLLCGHIWSNRNSEVVTLPESALSSDFAVPYGKLGNRILYLVTTCGLVIILDIDTMKMSMEEIPDYLVDECYDLDLCPGQSDFKFYLFGLTQSNLHIWYHDASGTSSNNWQQLHCIPIYGIFTDFMRSSFENMDLEDGLTLWGIGEQAEFVLLKAGYSIYHFNIETKNLSKAFQLRPEDGELQGIFPCMTVWPPKFPSSTRDNESDTRESMIADETVSPGTDSGSLSDVPQRRQNHDLVTFRPATRARRQLIKSKEGGADCTSSSDLLSIIAEGLDRTGGCNTADASQILSSGQERRVQIEALRQELGGVMRQIQALKSEKAQIEAEANNQEMLALKLESDLKILSDADVEGIPAQFEEEIEDSKVKLNFLLFCLSQEESTVKKLSTRLTELGEDADTLLQGI